MNTPFAKLLEVRARVFAEPPPLESERPVGTGLSNQAKQTTQGHESITPSLASQIPATPGDQSKQSGTSPPGDVITVLRASKLLAKTWCADGSIKSYDNAKNYSVEQHSVDGIHALSTLLKKLESDSHACIVRGRSVGFEAARKIEPLLPAGKMYRRNELFEDQPLHAVMIDVDNFDGVIGVVRHVEKAIDDYIASCLPDEFQGVSYHWQLSNSAGAPGNEDKLKAHIWFWLKTPYTSAQLKAWAEDIGLKADHSLFQKIQIHYTGAPVFEAGVANPVPVRSAFVSDLHDEVDLKIDTTVENAKPEPVTRAKKIKQAQSNDPIAQVLIDRGMVKSSRPDGALNIVCPFESEHSTDTGETATIYYLANTGTYARGTFVCKHDHCGERPQGAFVEALGLPTGASADDFDVLPVEGEDEYLVMPWEESNHLEPPVFIIKGVLPEAALAVIYGAPGSGKSFFALDLACAVASGIAWRGHRVKQGAAVYIAAEDAPGIRTRIKAYTQEHKIAPGTMPLGTIDAAPNFMDGKNIKKVERAVRAFGAVSLIFVDTWSRVIAGFDENSAADITKAVKHCAALHRATGATVVLIHHSGKDASKGARGSTALLGACDCEIEVIREGDERVATVTKLKNGADGARFGFKLNVVPVGMDADGDVVSSCVLEHSTAKPKAKQCNRTGGVAQKIAQDAFNDLAIGGPVMVADLIDATANQMTGNPGKRDTRRQRAIRAIDSLIADGAWVKQADGVIGQAGSK